MVSPLQSTDLSLSIIFNLINLATKLLDFHILPFNFRFLVLDFLIKLSILLLVFLDILRERLDGLVYFNLNKFFKTLIYVWFERDVGFFTNDQRLFCEFLFISFKFFTKHGNIPFSVLVSNVTDCSLML